MRFGVREICNVVFRAKARQTLGSRTFYKHEPVLYFDSLKTSTLEGAATTVYATGGRGNTRLIAWEGERTLTFTMEDALISPEGFAILSGAGLINATEEKPVYVHTTSQVEVKEDGVIYIPEPNLVWNGGRMSKDESHNTGNKQPVDKAHHESEADVFCMKLDDGGEISIEPCVPGKIEWVNKDGEAVPTGTDGVVGVKIYCFADGNGTAEVEEDDIVLVDYYVKRVGNVLHVDITPDKFAGNYYIEADSLFRRERDGVDMPAVFTIPNGKIQSNFTFNMASTGDPSTFTFTVDAFPDYTKFDRTKKVLAALDVIEDIEDTTEPYRHNCNSGQD